MDNAIELCELSLELNGAKILFSTDDFFGIAENLINEIEPSIEHHPDAWLTRRKRKNWKPDFTIIQLAAKAEIYFISLDIIYLTGDIPVQFSIQASQILTTDNDTLIEYQDRSNVLGRPITNEEPHIRQLYSETWPYLISWQPLNTDGYSSMSKKIFMIPSTGQVYTHLRFNIFPDGGISRLHVYGKVLKPIHMPSQNWLIDLVSNIYGGNCIAYSSCYNNTHPNNMIKPEVSLAMQDGWQTARSRFRIGDLSQPFNLNQNIEEWAIFQLGYSGKIASIKFKICYPEYKPYAVRVQGLREGVILNILNENDINNAQWEDIIPYTVMTIRGDDIMEITVQNQNIKMAYVKLSIKPDGCISRFQVLGEI